MKRYINHRVPLTAVTIVWHAVIMAARTCVVTGAGGGIGGAIASRLSAAGHRVALTGRRREPLDALAAALPGPSLTVTADVTDPSAADEVFQAVEARWGPVEVLVLNAGAGLSAPLARTTDEDWQHMLDLNLTAPFRFLRRAAPSMTGRGWGRVVLIASVAARHGAPYVSAYTAAKHGALGLVRSAAAELAGTGVTVNAVCPGFADTPMTVRTVERIAATTGRTEEQAREALERQQPIGRLITPDEVADAVDLCVLSSAITGQGINVDGGAVQA
jgi:NAD(P)-dependent dehydrogenase (short-subunit alcohol dehydrogenase family)